MVIRLVLFDIDGTLISAGGAGGCALERAFEEVYGVPQCLAGISLGGRTDASLFEEMYRVSEIEKKPVEHQRFIAVYYHLLHEYLQGSHGACLKGSKELVQNLAGLYPDIVLGLLTGNARLAAEIKLRHFNVWDPFVLGAFGDDHSCRDRLAAMAKDRAERHLGQELEGGEVLVVGDTLHDIRCAQSIEAVCLAVATGGVPFDKLRGGGPDYLVHDLTDVDVCAIVERQ